MAIKNNQTDSAMRMLETQVIKTEEQAENWLKEATDLATYFAKVITDPNQQDPRVLKECIDEINLIQGDMLHRRDASLFTDELNNKIAEVYDDLRGPLLKSLEDLYSRITANQIAQPEVPSINPEPIIQSDATAQTQAENSQKTAQAEQQPQISMPPPAALSVAPPPLQQQTVEAAHQQPAAQQAAPSKTEQKQSVQTHMASLLDFMRKNGLEKGINSVLEKTAAYFNKHRSGQEERLTSTRLGDLIRGKKLDDHLKSSKAELGTALKIEACKAFVYAAHDYCKSILNSKDMQMAKFLHDSGHISFSDYEKRISNFNLTNLIKIEAEIVNQLNKLPLENKASIQNWAQPYLNQIEKTYENYAYASPKSETDHTLTRSASEPLLPSRPRERDTRIVRSPLSSMINPQSGTPPSQEKADRGPEPTIERPKLR